ncbi:hypothetical protein MXB_1420 [Myxobolus squamalis]|nr:hypothetical protein MXB_1420 [Myxobolus squamalis]
MSSFKKYLWKNTALIVSSSSWTDDEDFDILLLALKEYDNKIHKLQLPSILCIITGKGCNKDDFMWKESQTKFMGVLMGRG